MASRLRSLALLLLGAGLSFAQPGSGPVVEEEFSCPDKPGDSGHQYPDGKDECVPDWIEKGGIFLVVVVLIVMFWILAVVCEEYFVPSLNELCVKANIPDDVAGATFMAAGASSPELFSAMVALFVTKSAAGVGTVIGSEIFNQLAITAGSIFYSNGFTLRLNRVILYREVTAYFVSIVMLLIVVLRTDTIVRDDGTEEKHIDVPWYYSLTLVRSAPREPAAPVGRRKWGVGGARRSPGS